MLKIGSGNQLVSTGKTFTGRVVQTTAGGYLVKFGENGRYTGVVETGDCLPADKDLLFKVIGQRSGQPLLHPVFAGYGR